MAKRTVEVTFMVEVETDDATFTPEFMQAFRESFYNFDTIDDHAEHIAYLAVRDMLYDNFTEGYGPLAKMGIKASLGEVCTQIIDTIHDGGEIR